MPRPPVPPPTKHQLALECRGLRRSFGDLVAVDGVGFHIDAGETYGTAWEEGVAMAGMRMPAATNE